MACVGPFKCLGYNVSYGARDPAACYPAYLDQKEKGLSTGEKKMLINAKQILVSELVLAERSSYEEMENIVDNKINAIISQVKKFNYKTTDSP